MLQYPGEQPHQLRPLPLGGGRVRGGQGISAIIAVTLPGLKNAMSAAAPGAT
jgi:hypothetical protein